MTTYKIQINEKKYHKYIKESSSYFKTFYLDLGVKIVRVLCYSELFMPYIKKHLTYSIKEKMPKYDVTLILWQEKL